MRQIANYRDLQDAVADWLNRADLNVRIPTFIYLGERKIFRRYRAPNNEKTITFRMRENPSYYSGGSNSSGVELGLTDTFDLPADYLETLTLQAGGFPLERVSLTEMQSLRQGSPREGQTRKYARERRRMLLWPRPDSDTDFRLIYYADLSGGFVSDSSDNDVLRTAPDLYLYASLVQAEPFLRATPEELQLMQVWKGLYEEAFAEIEFQRDEDERSGSNVVMKSGYHA
jgi:hypothetical protein